MAIPGRRRPLASEKMRAAGSGLDSRCRERHSAPSSRERVERLVGPSSPPHLRWSARCQCRAASLFGSHCGDAVRAGLSLGASRRMRREPSRARQHQSLRSAPDAAGLSGRRSGRIPRRGRIRTMLSEPSDNTRSTRRDILQTAMLLSAAAVGGNGCTGRSRHRTGDSDTQDRQVAIRSARRHLRDRRCRRLFQR